MHYKQINAETDINGSLVKRYELVSPDCIEQVSYDMFKSSPLPDMTERDMFGGIIYNA